MHLGFGWDGIGYHAVIIKDGTIEQGRPHFWSGAHVYGHNEESLGVCLIGQNDFTPEQMTALDGLLRDWIARYPQARICGHRDFPNTQKTCPNFDVATWVKDRGLAG
jgi:N-acetyl-anhydromuramyl-L-alanine amidase AmpD